MIYTVKKGDTVYSIASKFGVSPAMILSDNCIEDPSHLVIGEDIVILFPAMTHTVSNGDTLSSIAERYGTTVRNLYRNNPSLGGEDTISAGQVLTISYDSSAKLGDISLNGYAYPNIDPAVLKRTLPYLTYISIFTYGIKDDGTLIPPSGDEKIIEEAKKYGTVPLMMLTSLTENGTFSDALVAKILSDREISDKVISEAAAVMNEKGYGGIDVDFEYISSDYKEAYPDFLKRLKNRIGDKVLFASLAPKTSSDMKGLLYEGHDYNAVGNSADRVLLMTYEWGYTYGPPMAVSPINKVKEVIDYGIGEIPSYKIFMGMPNYGYDWALPFVKGESMARSLSNVDAVKLAAEKGGEIMFDETAKSPYFAYYEKVPDEVNAVEHVVWFEDARSVEAMAYLAEKSGLSGIAVWNIMRYFPQMWLVLNSLFDIK